jgi:hypothetical protein
MPELLRLYRCAAVGWETVAECEACASRGDLSGCFACDGRGWRQLTEDEEDELSEMQG